jgi:hypothetical protein
VRAAPATARRMSAGGSVRRRVCALATLAVLWSACRGAADDALRGVAVPRVAAPRQTSALLIDTVGGLVLDLWPLNVASRTQMKETRRIVELMHADLAVMPGFERAALLASGDGNALALVIAWASEAAADSARTRLMGWLKISSDTVARRTTFGTSTPRIRIRRIVGTPPMLSDAAVIQLTRFAMKPGHSYGALATLADSNVSQRVLQDTSAQGGATLVAADSGAIYILTRARNATALDAEFRPDGPLPYWAPFAVRDEKLMAVVAVVGRR